MGTNIKPLLELIKLSNEEYGLMDLISQLPKIPIEKDLKLEIISEVDRLLKEFERFNQEFKPSYKNENNEMQKFLLDNEYLSKYQTHLSILSNALNIWEERIINDLKISNNTNSLLSTNNFENRLKEILNNSLDSYLRNKKERNTLQNMCFSLLITEIFQSYNISLILMGSIIEFLLERYCKSKNIPPEPFNGSHGNRFANYIESAIKNNIFEEKRRWEIVQSHLRDFRNYIHISKAVKSEEIDKKWYETIKPIYEALINKFSSNVV